MGVGDVHRCATTSQYERFRTPRPRDAAAAARRAPVWATGRAFGDRCPNRRRPERPLLDEVELAHPAGHSRSRRGRDLLGRRTRCRSCARSRPHARRCSPATATASCRLPRRRGSSTPTAGLLLGRRLDDDPRRFDQRAERRRRPGGHRHEPQGGAPMGRGPRERRATPRRPTRSRSTTTRDNRLALFPGAADTAVHRRRAARRMRPCRASAYGNALTYTPGDRAAQRDGRRSPHRVEGRRLRRRRSASGSRSIATCRSPPTTSGRPAALEHQPLHHQGGVTFDGAEPEHVRPRRRLPRRTRPALTSLRGPSGTCDHDRRRPTGARSLLQWRLRRRVRRGGPRRSATSPRSSVRPPTSSMPPATVDRPCAELRVHPPCVESRRRDRRGRGAHDASWSSPDRSSGPSPCSAGPG